MSCEKCSLGKVTCVTSIAFDARGHGLVITLTTSCETPPELCDANANVIGIISAKFIIETVIPLNKIKSPNVCTRQLLSI